MKKIHSIQYLWKPQNRLFIVHEVANFDVWSQINISSCVWLLPKKGSYYVVVKTLCENNAHTYVLNILDGHLCMRFTLSCPSDKSSYSSWITLFAEHVVSKWNSPSTRYSNLDILVSCHFILYDNRNKSFLQSNCVFRFLSQFLDHIWKRSWWSVCISEERSLKAETLFSNMDLLLISFHFYYTSM